MTLRPRAATVVVRAILTLTLALAALVALPRAAAVAADLSGFEAGDIMSDSIFFDPTTMSSADIATFLAAKGAACVAGSDGSPCLKDYRETTLDRAATERCAAYTGANETAAQIIAKVATACGINPQVLIVILQKEQGLVTTTNPDASRYSKAMGYGCPDSGVCNTAYAGFSAQVYWAASQFRYYALHPTYFRFRPGMTITIPFSPVTACGGSSVYIDNQATAGLYNYTPYQPNAASLAAGYSAAGNVDYSFTTDPNQNGACASYGNRNFWNYFTDWFGSTTQRPPIGDVEAVGVSGQTITVSGWALDPDTTNPTSVRIDVDSVSQDFVANTPRADVGAAFGKGNNHGFAAKVPFPAGTHQVCVYALDTSGGPSTTLTCQTAG